MGEGKKFPTPDIGEKKTFTVENWPAGVQTNVSPSKFRVGEIKKLWEVSSKLKLRRN